jgi:hypothetical protein
VLNFPTAMPEKPEIADTAGVGNNGTHLVCHTLHGDRAASDDCYAARRMANAWVKRQGYGSQGRLASMAGISASKLSRFLKDEAGRRTLTVGQLDRLLKIVLPTISGPEARP